MAEDDKEKTPEEPKAPEAQEVPKAPEPSEEPKAQAPPEPPKVEGAASSVGIDPKVAGVLCYALTWVTGLIFYLIEKENKEIRFHALQALLFGIAWTGIWIAISILTPILAFIFSGFGILMGLVSFVSLVVFLILWIMLMVRAYQGERWKLPVIGDIAERNA